MLPCMLEGQNREGTLVPGELVPGTLVLEEAIQIRDITQPITPSVTEYVYYQHSVANKTYPITRPLRSWNSGLRMQMQMWSVLTSVETNVCLGQLIKARHL